MADDFESEIRNVFIDEAKTLLEDVEQCFLNLENTPNKSAIVEKIFRLAHNLKGSANAVGFSHLGEFTHEFESFLLKIKSGTIEITGPVVDVLLRCKDFIARYTDMLRLDHGACLDFSDLIKEMRSDFSSSTSESDGFHEFTDTDPTPKPLCQVQAIATEIEPEITNIERQKPRTTAQATPDEMIRVSLQRVEKLINFVGEMVILQSVLREQVQISEHILLKKAVHQLGKVTKEVQDISMSLRMVPLKQTFQKMQRIVRDTANALNKNVKLTLEGEDTEIDKTILEQLSDPLVHLVRNAVDHGVEGPELRKERGKNPTANITLRALHEGGKLVLEVKDDGVGLDAAGLRKKAIEKGLLKADAVISDDEAYNLIFHPGFSTKAVVTDVSGRGVGMDVVKTNIAQLQGDIELKTELGRGTCIRVQLPLTMAIIDAMTVTVDNQRYVIPLAQVHESVKPAPGDVHHSATVGDLYCLRGENLPLYFLSNLLGTSKQARTSEKMDQIAIVVRSGEEDFAVIVDDILGQTQVVIKHLGDEHRDLRGFGGSAILGDGRAALILELPELVNRVKAKLGSIQSSKSRRQAA